MNSTISFKRPLLEFSTGARKGMLGGLLSLFVSCLPAVAGVTVINMGDTWKYNVPASDPGSGWKTVGFNDSGWSSGPALLGFDADSIPAPGIQTTIGTSGSPQMVYLFRKTFNYSGGTAGVQIAIDQMVDDGVTYYLNGTFLGSSRHTPGNWNNVADAPVGNAAEEVNAINVPTTALVNGSNVLSAEVHQVAVNGSDLVFGVRVSINEPSLTSVGWRQQYFQTTNNSGNAADLADPDGDRLANLLEYALSKDPNKPTGSWAITGVSGNNLTFTYSRRKSALAEVAFACEWSVSPTGPWSGTGVTEQILSDDGSMQSVRAQVAAGSSAKLFFKLKATVTASPPMNDNADFVAFPNQGWGTSDMRYLENDVIRVGFRESVGACICHISLKSDNRGLINDYRLNHNGQTISDKGRQVQFFSDYFTPGNAYIINGQNTANYGFDTGANVVQGGSLAPYFSASPVLASGIQNVSGKGLVFYAKVQPYIWGVPAELGNVIGEQWVWLNGRTICYHVRHTILERTDNQRKWMAREQENPCAYLIAPLRNHKIVTGTPWVGNGSIDVAPSSLTFTPVLMTSEHWLGGYEGNGIGITLYTPRNSLFRGAQFIGYFGDENSNDCGYINACPMVDYDTPGVYDDFGYIIAGTESEARQTINNLPRPDPSFNFDFSADHQMWFTGDARSRRINGDLLIYIGDANNDGSRTGSFISPYRTWKAVDLNTIEVEMAVSGISQLNIIWNKPGQATSFNYQKHFPLIGDGQMRVYTITMAGTPNWDGTISSFGFQNITQGLSGNETLKVKRIRKVN